MPENSSEKSPENRSEKSLEKSTPPVLAVGPEGEALIMQAAQARESAPMAQPTHPQRRAAQIKAQWKALELFDIVAETDVKGMITFANDRFCAISKYSREELIGQNHRIINSGYHPKTFFKEMWSTISSGKIWTGEIRNRGKDGTFYWVSTVIMPILSDDQKVVGYLSVRRDVTRQKEAEEALNESDLRFRELLENVNLLAVGLDREGHINFANEAVFRLLGKRESEVLGRGWFDNFVTESSRTLARLEMTEVLKGKASSQTYEGGLLTSQAGVRTVVWQNTPFRNHRGEISGSTLLGEDVTEKRANEARVREMEMKVEKERQEVVAFVCHEIKSPLMSLRAASELLKDEGASDAGLFQSCIAKILSSIERIDRMSKDLLGSLTNQRREIHFDFSKNDFSRLIENVVLRTKEEIEAKSIPMKIFWDYHSGPLEFYFDAGRMDQVLSNLFSNSIKYKKPEVVGEIRVSLSRDEAFALIRVDDNGLGIPPENLASIFDIFVRGQNVLGGATVGYGLGLKICKDIIEKHGGEITVQSELGVGTKFTIRMPIRLN